MRRRSAIKMTGFRCHGQKEANILISMGSDQRRLILNDQVLNGHLLRTWVAARTVQGHWSITASESVSAVAFVICAFEGEVLSVLSYAGETCHAREIRAQERTDGETRKFSNLRT